jgi:hypothetical protein
VVLRGDVDAAALQVLDRVVGAAVAEGKLEGLEAHRPAEQLVAEADADHRLLAHHSPDVLDDVVERARVAGAVGEKDQVRVAGENVLGRGVAGEQRHPAPTLLELADDRELDPGVDPHHVRAVACDLDRLIRRDRLREVRAVHGWLGGDAIAGV